MVMAYARRVLHISAPHFGFHFLNDALTLRSTATSAPSRSISEAASLKP